MELDKLDHEILRLLGANGRTSNREIGRLLNISEGAVRQRLRKLADGKAMRLGLIRDLSAAGLSAGLVVRLNIAPAQAREAANRLAALECCHFVSLAIGRYNVTAVLTGQDRPSLADIFEQHIATLPGLRDLSVREQLGLLKHRFDLVHVL